MRIKTTVKLSTFLIISVVLLYSVFAVIINRTVESKYRDLRTASGIRSIFSQLRSLTTDYVLYRTERAHQQWWTVQGELLRRLNTPEYQTFQRQYRVEDLDDRLKLMGEAFTRLTATIGITGLSAPAAEANQEFQSRLITQIMVTSREISTVFDKLSANISRNVLSLQQRSIWLEVIALLILISFIIINSIFLSRSVVKPVLQLHEGAEIIGRGTLDYRMAIAGSGEIRELSQAFNRMTANLLVEITERQQAEQALRESEQRLRYLTSKILTTQEQERKRIAMELHEGLGQSMTALKMHLRFIQRQVPTESVTIEEDFNGAQKLLKEMIEDVRRISRGLSPALLETLGLTAALKHLLDEFGKYQNATIQADTDDIENLFSPQTETSLFRIFQESLNNIAKHAQATQISVTIKRQDGRVNFLIKDNGVGFDPEQITHNEMADKGMGLAAMDERLRMIGAHLNIASQKSNGTEISFSIPIDAGKVSS
jgi:signal transduction histidine kinase